MANEMDATEMRRLLNDLGWSLADLIRFTGRERARTQKQARGKEPIDPAMAFWLRGYHFFALNPPPRPPPQRSTSNGREAASGEPVAGEPDRVSAA